MKVLKAQPYCKDALGSCGDASGMLIRQFQFPNKYDEKMDKIMSADSDRCLMWDRQHARRCFEEHTGCGELSLGGWLRQSSNDNILKFLKDILKADVDVVWTGYRVLGTVNRSNGYIVWTLELFAKHPKTKTKVYTGNKAPNVESPSRELDYF